MVLLWEWPKHVDPEEPQLFLDGVLSTPSLAFEFARQITWLHGPATVKDLEGRLSKFLRANLDAIGEGWWELDESSILRLVGTKPRTVTRLRVLRNAIARATGRPVEIEDQ